MDELNSKVISETVANLVARASERILGRGKVLAKSVYHDAKVLFSSHDKYIRQVRREFESSKSFLNTTTRSPFRSFYIPLGARRDSTSYPELDMEKLTVVENMNVITGPGGAGKSTLMQHLLLESLSSGKKVPVFVRLREIDFENGTLIEAFREILFQNGFHRDNDFFQLALEAGHFALFLDGFDEVRNKEIVTSEIRNLASEFEKNYVTVSSRPNSAFSGWNDFNVWKVLPLTLDKACEIVEGAPKHILNRRTSRSFVDDLRNGLFNSHMTFVSNPLLLSVMILIYKDCGVISHRFSLYYGQAFATLFYGFDAWKSGYRRQRRSGLDIQEFAKVFAAFCLLTYHNGKINLTEKAALEFLSRSKKLVSLTFDERDYLEDCEQAVSVLILDGLMISFLHRSFQDYFVAEYIRSLAPQDLKGKLIRQYLPRQLRDDKVFELLFEAAPQLVESVFLIPEINAVESRIDFEGELNLEIYRNFLTQSVESITFEKTAHANVFDMGLTLTRFGKATLDLFEVLAAVCFLEIQPSIVLSHNEESRGYVYPTEFRISDPRSLVRIQKGEVDKANKTYSLSISEALSIAEVLDFLRFKHRKFSMQVLGNILNAKKDVVTRHSDLDDSLLQELFTLEQR